MNEKGYVYQCHKICGGEAEGEAVISGQAICFYRTDSRTGNLTEKGHDLEGKSVSGKALIFPGGKGSSVVQYDGLYMLTKEGTAPRALIIKHPDPVLVSSAIILGIPLVDRVEDAFYKEVEEGDLVRVNGEKGLVTLMKPRK